MSLIDIGNSKISLNTSSIKKLGGKKNNKLKMKTMDSSGRSRRSSHDQFK